MTLLKKLKEGTFKPPSEDDVKKRQAGLKYWRITVPKWELGIVQANTAEEAKEVAEEGDFIETPQMQGGILPSEMEAEEVEGYE